MKLSNAKYLALLGVFCAVLPCFAAEWYITHWSGGNKEEKNNRFTEAVNSAKDGDVLILQNDITVNADAELKIKPNERRPPTAAILQDCNGILMLERTR